MDKNNKYITVNLGEYTVSYYIDWDTIKEEFEEYLSDKGMLPLDIGATLDSGTDDFATEMANEEGVEIDWKILNKEISEYENAVLKYLKGDKRYTETRDEGHDGNNGLNLVFKVIDKDLTEKYKDTADSHGEGVVYLSDPSYAVDIDLYKVVDKLRNKSKFLHYCDLYMTYYLPE